MLVLICGLPGTGKSTIANALARKIEATVLRTDEIRKELFREPRYSEEEKELVYRATFLIAAYLLKSRRNVIIDGTFYRRAIRKRIYEIAGETKSRLKIVECVAPEYIIRRRMESRARRMNLLSDADYEVYKKIKNEFEPIQREHIIIDTSKDPERNLKELYEKLHLR